MTPLRLPLSLTTHCSVPSWLDHLQPHPCLLPPHLLRRLQGMERCHQGVRRNVTPRCRVLHSHDLHPSLHQVYHGALVLYLCMLRFARPSSTPSPNYSPPTPPCACTATTPSTTCSSPLGRRWQRPLCWRPASPRPLAAVALARPPTRQGRHGTHSTGREKSSEEEGYKGQN